MRALFVTSHRPAPARYGTEIRARAQLDALESIADVDLFWLGQPSVVQSADYYRARNVVGVLPWEPGPKREPLRALVRRAGANGVTLPTYIPNFYRYFQGSTHDLQGVKYFPWSRYDLLYFVRPEAYWYFGMPNPAQTIVDIDDVQSLHVRQAIATEPRASKRLLKRLSLWNIQREERRIISRCGASLVCSEADRVKLGLDGVNVFPNGYPDHGQALVPISAGESNTLIFVGALNYGPNRRAVHFFTNRVLPHIRREIPNATLLVVGELPRDAADPLYRCEGIRLLGRVEDLAPIIRTAAIEVAPLLEGLGTRIKILEAISFGKPVVATSIGAYGISLGLNEGVFREDEPEGMAATCVRLMRSPEQRVALGRIGRDRVSELYGQPALNHRMKEIVDRVLSR
jgi:glycosyltransferase involved in cell wall biosynthesis